MLLVVALVTIIVVFQNTDSVDTRILFFTVSMPRAALLAITFLSGLVVGLLFGFRKPKAKT